MTKNFGMPLIAAGVAAIIGLLTISWNFWIGAVICLAAGVGAIWAGTRVEKRKPPQIQMTIPGNPADEQAMSEFLSESPVNRKVLSALTRTLRQADLDPRAPLLVNDANQPVLTVQEILVEMISIAEAHRLPASELIADISKIYPRIAGNVQQAVIQYPSDLELLTLWLANRSLKDVRKELEVQN